MDSVIQREKPGRLDSQDSLSKTGRRSGQNVSGGERQNGGRLRSENVSRIQGNVRTHFLQREVLKQSNEFTFSDTSTFLIKPKESLNATWVFDAANNISAEIIDVNQETIFGIIDSVKTILLDPQLTCLG